MISFATLRHEWLPSLCLVTALAAILCPVVLILGLKHGTVENLRQGLLRDPSTLEVRPRTSFQVDDKLLNEIRAMEGVEFVVPKTRSLGSASVEFEFGEQRVDVDLLPTAPGDPLLKVHRCLQPDFTEVVLTASAAKSLSANIGDNVVMFLSRRTSDGRGETVNLPLTVKGVLPEEATTIKAGYVQLPLLSAVEEYRENLAVPSLGWTGPESQVAEPIFDGFLVLPDEAIPAGTISRVSVATGFLSHRRLLPDDPDTELALASRDNSNAVLFFNDNNPRSESSFEPATGIIGSSISSIHAWSRPCDVSITLADGTEKSHRLHTMIRPFNGVNDITVTEHIWIAMPIDPAGGMTAKLTRKSPVGSCTISCKVVRLDDDAPDGVVYAPPSITGILRHLDNRHLEWDPVQHRLLLGRRSFSSIRLYASSLSSVSPVTTRLAAMGIDCSSEGAKIAKVMKFDRDLSMLFWLVSSFSFAGGGAALTLSLYGAIERRRRDYAMLRTLGLPRSWLALLPLIEAVSITLLAFLTAMLVYHLNATVINRLFSDFDEERPGFCFLPVQLQIRVLLGSLVLAAVGSMAAATRLLSMSLSKAIRHA